MKKRMISLFLVAVMGLSLSTSAFATAPVHRDESCNAEFEEFKKNVNANTITFSETKPSESELRLMGANARAYEDTQKALTKAHNAAVVEEAKEYVYSLNLPEAGLSFIEKSCIKELDSYATLEDTQILSYTVYTPKTDISEMASARSNPVLAQLTYLGTYQARDFYTYFPSSLTGKSNVKKDTNRSTLQQWANLALDCTLVFSSVEVNVVWTLFKNLMGAPAQYTVKTGAFTESYCNLNTYTRGIYTLYGNGEYDMVTSQQYAKTYPYMVFHPVDSPTYNGSYNHDFGYQGNVYSPKYSYTASQLCQEAWQVFNGAVVYDRYDTINTNAFRTIWG